MISGDGMNFEAIDAQEDVSPAHPCATLAQDPFQDHVYDNLSSNLAQQQTQRLPVMSDGNLVLVMHFLWLSANKVRHWSCGSCAIVGRQRSDLIAIDGQNLDTLLQHLGEAAPAKAFVPNTRWTSKDLLHHNPLPVLNNKEAKGATAVLQANLKNVASLEWSPTFKDCGSAG